MQRDCERPAWYDSTVSIRGRLLALLFVTAGAVASLPAETTRLPPAAEQAITRITADELRAHVEVLASDEMAGRAVGHPGNRRAVEYVAQALRRAHVAPATDTYYHGVELYQPTLAADGRLTITGPAREPIADLTPGTSFYPLPESSDATVTGPLVSVGHGISAPKLRHDDYSPRDVHGAIVIVQDDAPDGLRRRAGGLTEGERIGLATLERKIADAHSHGAIGVVIVRASPDAVRTVWPAPSSLRSTSSRLPFRARSTPMAVAVISQEAAEPVLRALQSKSALTATLRPGVVVQRITVHNVLATLEPSRSSDELVVVRRTSITRASTRMAAFTTAPTTMLRCRRRAGDGGRLTRLPADGRGLAVALCLRCGMPKSTGRLGPRRSRQHRFQQGASSPTSISTWSGAARMCRIRRIRDTEVSAARPRPRTRTSCTCSATAIRQSSPPSRGAPTRRLG
jgi:hypothetical protein